MDVLIEGPIAVAEEGATRPRHAHGSDIPHRPINRKRKRTSDDFGAALAALAGPGRVNRPYADDADRRMGSIQRAGGVAGKLARMRDGSPAPIDGALALPASALRFDNNDGSTRSFMSALFGWVNATVIEDSTAWDAIDLDAVPDRHKATALIIAEWIDDCFCARPSERHGLVECARTSFAHRDDDDHGDAGACFASTQCVAHNHHAVGGDFTGGADIKHNADDIVSALWLWEQFEAGAGIGSVRARPGLDHPQGDAVCLRIAAVSAVKHVAPDYEDVTEIFDAASLGRDVARVGRLYRSITCDRLARLYAVYDALADAVDRTRCAGRPAPPQRLPTPRSAKAWIVSRPGESDAFALSWLGDAPVDSQEHHR